MTDREKIIGELEVIKYFFRQCREHFSLGSDVENSLFDLQEAASEAITLLKEQEAVEPILEQDSMVCGVCGHEIIWQKMLGDGIWADEELDYCPHCGRAVKWG